MKQVLKIVYPEFHSLFDMLAKVQEQIEFPYETYFKNFLPQMVIVYREKNKENPVEYTDFQILQQLFPEIQQDGEFPERERAIERFNALEVYGHVYGFNPPPEESTVYQEEIIEKLTFTVLVHTKSEGAVFQYYDQDDHVHVSNPHTGSGGYEPLKVEIFVPMDENNQKKYLSSFSNGENCWKLYDCYAAQRKPLKINYQSKEGKFEIMGDGYNFYRTMPKIAKMDKFTILVGDEKQSNQPIFNRNLE